MGKQIKTYEIYDEQKDTDHLVVLEHEDTIYEIRYLVSIKDDRGGVRFLYSSPDKTQAVEKFYYFCGYYDATILHAKGLINVNDHN